ncbi:MAG: carboxypeptidase-like regulatory domain-containing protein, partial [Bacteroidetes bacterium]|nr:carboxypeptidase-like regulatory domain-containing protein [Bacteroidota bacterium]
MSRIKLVFFGILFLSLINVYGQKGVLSGVVVDESTKDKIPFASVAIFNSGSENPEGGTITDDAGNFTVKNISSGNYTIEVSFIGYNKSSLENISITRESNKVSLGEIILTPSNVKLDVVEVTAMQK